jgi:Ni/Co efflux regulator RcnB
MKTVIKAIIATTIIATSYTASARDGAFTGNVSFNNQANNTVVARHYAVNGTADKSHSGIVVTNKNTQMTFAEKLLSAADKS